MNMKIMVLAALAVPAAPSFAAESISPGAAMLAGSVGVRPGVYSVNELVQLRAALDDDDEQSFQRIVDEQADNVRISTQAANSFAAESVSPGAAMLAGSVGVKPGVYSVNELAQMRAALDDNDEQGFQLIVDERADDVRISTQAATDVDRLQTAGSSAAERVSPGKAQLAASLGVDAADYTLNELVRMLPEGDD